MTTAEILATAGATKTWKMQQLFHLGHSRTEVAGLLNVGYGFVQNVYTAWMNAGGRLGHARAAARPRATRARLVATPAPTSAPAPVAAPVPFTAGPFTRTFGVEIEGYNVPREALVAELRAQGLEAHSESYNHVTRPHWKVTTDGSISGAHGFELVSPILRGLEGLAQLEAACRALRACGAKVNKSCGLHVHFGMREAGLEHTKRAVRNYLALESTLDQVMAPSRRGDTNRYCKSLLRSRPLATAERAILGANTMADLQTAANAGCRYHKVNVMAFGQHGTLEFRQHSASTDFEKISMWVKLLHALVDYSAQHQVAAGLPTERFTTFAPQAVATYYQRRRTALAAAR